MQEREARELYSSISIVSGIGRNREQNRWIVVAGIDNNGVGSKRTEQGIWNVARMLLVWIVLDGHREMLSSGRGILYLYWTGNSIAEECRTLQIPKQVVLYPEVWRFASRQGAECGIYKRCPEKRCSNAMQDFVVVSNGVVLGKGTGTPDLLQSCPRWTILV